MTVFIPIISFSVFIAGVAAIRTGQVAWSRTKMITGTSAKVIGVVLIVVSVLLFMGAMFLSIAVTNGVK